MIGCGCTMMRKLTVQFHHHPEQTKPRLWPGEGTSGYPRQHTAQSVGDQPWWRKEHGWHLGHAQCHPQCHAPCNHHCQHLLCQFFTLKLWCVNSMSSVIVL